MPDLDLAKHKQYNKTVVLPQDENVTAVRFWDVGTGNCNTLMDGVRQLVYYDFGGNAPAGGGCKTYPTEDNPARHPGFDFTNNPVFVVSHWDEDHFYSLKKRNDAGGMKWLGTRDDISNRGKGQLVTHVGKNVKCLVRGLHDKLKFDTDSGVRVTLVRCTDNVGHAPDRRNNSGVAMFVHVGTPARTLVKEMSRLAKAPLATANSVAAAGAMGTDIYVNFVKEAATWASTQPNASAASTHNAARTALETDVVKKMAKVVILALDARNGGATAVQLDLAVRAVYPLPQPIPWIGDIVSAISANKGGSADQQIAAAKLALCPGVMTNTAAKVVVAMVEYALGLGHANDKDGTITAGVTAAGVAPIRDPYCRAVLGAAARKNKDDPAATARDVANAALEALAPPPQMAWSLMFSGDASYHCVPNMATTKWDLLLAYHHGTSNQFLEKPPGEPPIPTLRDQSWIVYSSGKRYDNGVKVYDHPVALSIAKYRDRGWKQEYYTARGYGTNSNPANANALHLNAGRDHDFQL